MFFTAGYEASVDTLRGIAGVDDTGALKPAYQRWLRSKGIPAVAVGEGAAIDFVDAAADEGELLRGFITSDDVDEPRPMTDELIGEILARRNASTLRPKLARLRKACAALRDVEPRLAEVFDVVVNRVFVAELEREVGGSNPKHAGVIWANPPENASDWDVLEYLVHEFTHQMLYLDEQLYGHYVRCAPEDVLKIPSTIRRTKRPIDATFHSLVVALEVLALRRRVAHADVSKNLHPATEPLMLSCRATMDALLDVDDWRSYLRPRGRYLFDRCRKLWEELARTSPDAGPLFDAC